MNKIATTLCGVMLTGALVSGSPAIADSESDFFKAKTVKVIVGFGPGGGFDRYARLLARHYGRHLPGGQATVIVQNMPGASGIKSGNYIYSVAPRDGSVIAIFNKSMPTYEVLGRKAVRFKSAELGWIGGIDNPNTTISVMASAGINSLDDAKKSDVLMGAVSVSGTQSIYPAMLNNLLNTKFRVIHGYRGSKGISLAMERGEVVGVSLPWSSWVSSKPGWVRDGKLKVLAQLGLKKDPSIPGPFLLDLVTNDEHRQILKLISTDITIGRTFVAPPKLAEARLASHRKAFDNATRDPKLIADGKKQRLGVTPSSGQEVALLIADMFKTPASIIEKTKAAISTKGAIKGKCKGSAKKCRQKKAKKKKTQ
jgi:tripartite-type tricarboxylate transporter receptor subunit TctC